MAVLQTKSVQQVVRPLQSVALSTKGGLLTTELAAKIIGVHPHTIRVACNYGNLAYITPAGSHIRLVTIPDLNLWLARRPARNLPCPAHLCIQVDATTFTTFLVERSELDQPEPAELAAV